MSLQVWLPLNGNLKNQGLSNISFTNSGATVNTVGKIGSCYSFDGTDDRMYATGVNLPSKNISICTWFYKASTATSAGYLIALNSNGGYADCTIGMDTDFISGKITACAGGNSNLQFEFSKDQWNHVVVTFDGTKIIAYLNGVKMGEEAWTTGLTRTNLTIGARANNAAGAASAIQYPFKGKMNDVRIYSHALSPMEVHEIYKAKILHLKLSDNYNSITNAYNYPTFNTSTATGGWNHWGPSGHLGTYGQNTDSKYIYYPNQTYSHWIAEGNPIGTSGKYYICYQSPAFEGGYRSVQFIIKEQNSLPITNSICIPAWNGKVTGTTPMTEWTEIVSLGNGFYLCKCDGFQQDGSNDLVSILVFTGYKIYITQAVLENDKKMCGDIFRQGYLTNLYDCSGYRHNAIQNAVTSSPDTARYGSSAIFNGSSSYVKVNDNTWMAQGADALTVSVWVKVSSWPANTRIFSCTEAGGFNIDPDTDNSGYYDVNFDAYTNAAQTTRAYQSLKKALKIADLPTNTWIMITTVFTNTSITCYVNGEQTATTTISCYGLHYNTSARLFLGCEANVANPTSPYFNGQMSDFRIYATALSVEDILQLYHTSTMVDDKGNVFAREVKEV